MLIEGFVHPQLEGFLSVGVLELCIEFQQCMSIQVISII